MSAAHTPGPWHLGGNGFIIYSADGFAVADVKTFHRRRDDGPNARLMTAAPELAEAAHLALQLIKDTWIAEHGNEQVGRAWGALHAALCKAGVR